MKSDIKAFYNFNMLQKYILRKRIMWSKKFALKVGMTRIVMKDRNISHKRNLWWQKFECVRTIQSVTVLDSECSGNVVPAQG